MRHSRIDILAASATLLLCGQLGSRAQVYSDWSVRDTTVVTSMEEGTVKETDYAAQGIFMDWGTTLSEFDNYDGDTALDETPASVPASTAAVTLRGLQLNLPSLVDENGIDLYLLTTEGIHIYMALDSPVYHQDPDRDVIKWIRYYAYEKREHTRRLFRRYERWEPLIRKYFAARGVPPELAEICLIESGCTYEALSSAGALGMWQIMPETGRRFGLVVNELRDDRKDPVLSTKAAAEILLSNYKRVGEWTLAAAAYNCGSGRILGQMKGGRNHWEAVRPGLPKETRQYIPSLLAIHYVWTYRDRLAL